MNSRSEHWWWNTCMQVTIAWGFSKGRTLAMMFPSLPNEIENDSAIVNAKLIHSGSVSNTPRNMFTAFVSNDRLFVSDLFPTQNLAPQNKLHRALIGSDTRFMFECRRLWLVESQTIRILAPIYTWRVQYLIMYRTYNHTLCILVNLLLRGQFS